MVLGWDVDKRGRQGSVLLPSLSGTRFDTSSPLTCNVILFESIVLGVKRRRHDL